MSSTDLITIGQRPSVAENIRRVWAYRFFVIKNSRARAISRHANYRLGSGWFLLRPVLDIAVYGIIFGVLLQTSRGVDNFLAFLIVGVGYFNPMSSSLNDAAGLLHTYRNLSRSFNFPKATIVVSGWLTNLLSTIPSVMLMSAVGLVIGNAPSLRMELVLLVPLWILLYMFTLGLYFLVAFATHFIPDLKVAISTLSRIWFYISGVFFSLETFSDSSLAMWLSHLNPAFYVLEIARDILVYGSPGEVQYWAYLAVFSIPSAIFGFIIFTQGESKYAE